MSEKEEAVMNTMKEAGIRVELDDSGLHQESFPTPRQVDILTQALNCLASHHEEYGIDITEMGEMVELALLLRGNQLPVKITFPEDPDQLAALRNDMSVKEVRGLGQHS